MEISRDPYDMAKHIIRKLKEQISVLRSVARKSKDLMINQRNNLLKDLMASLALGV